MGRERTRLTSKGRQDRLCRIARSGQRAGGCQRMMEAPLRAFLMMRSSDGTWTVTVCRDLGAVMRTWKMRKEPDREVAVLHIGFERPPSHCFDQISEAYPGRMLLTAAAKHVLPNSFVASATPVGVAESDEVFIGLQGWGYTLEDPTAGTDHVELPCPDTVAHEPQGWVSSLLNEYPSDAETLSAQGIFDEASYLDRETGLEPSVRHRAGLFRAHHIVGANCEDPCKLARAAPPWLVEQELTPHQRGSGGQNRRKRSGEGRFRQAAQAERVHQPSPDAGAGWRYRSARQWVSGEDE